jgi:hypothetical protein
MKPRVSSLQHIFFSAIILLFMAGNPPATSAPHQNPERLSFWNPISELFRKHTMESSPGQLGEAPAFADFDGDQKADMAMARLSKDRYKIVVLLSKSSEAAVLDPSVPLTGFQVLACDINSDSFQDIVVTDAIAKQPLAIWLGDGRGHFEIADQNLFNNAFAFTEPSAYQNSQFSPDQDLLNDSQDPTCGKTIRLTVNPELEWKRFVALRTIFCTLQKTHALIAPRSPPTIHPSQTIHLEF